MKRYFLILILTVLFLPKIILASSLSLSPSAGTFSVGSTFNVAVLLDTKGKSVNAMQIFLSYPADKLQIVSPSTGKSIVGVWASPPKFDNSKGTMSLEGGVPGGIVVSSGVITNITFRVKSTGEGIVRFKDDSEIYLDDGLATKDLSQASNAVYQFRLPPPAGPTVVSETHSDQSIWYQSKNVILRFANEAGEVGGFSYILNNDPVSEPDNISEGTLKSVAYNDLDDGKLFFHIKALRDGLWGGTTHFAINIDATPPSPFPVDILPSSRTASTSPVAQFATTDQLSGVDYYEIKIEPLSTDAINVLGSGASLYVEATSPYVIPKLVKGSYDVTVRVFDKAQNVREIKKHLTITNLIFGFMGDNGVRIRGIVTLPWILAFGIGILLLLVLLYGAYRVWRWRQRIILAHGGKKLPEDIARELSELQKYREKYGASTLVVLFILLSFLSFNSVKAQTTEIAPPLIDTVSENISNKEIFYIGGKTNIPEQEVVLYFQNLISGETLSYNVLSDKDGNWFYRHNKFLPAGEFLLWTQSKKGETMSPPSPQERITVEKTAIQFGANRLSYEVIYLFVIILLGLALIGLIIFIIYHYHHGRKKYLEFQNEIRNAEESIKRGFAILHRDIQAELAVIGKMKLSKELVGEEKQKEEQLMRDLDDVQKRIGDEIWQIKKETW
ncbi:MAG: Cohesin protein [Patescibacteria group bacterium]|nr:Cohesin protein [Patescibacteria group bacterium]